MNTATHVNHIPTEAAEDTLGATALVDSTHVEETKSSSIPKSSNAISALDFDTRTQMCTSNTISCAIVENLHVL